MTSQSVPEAVHATKEYVLRRGHKALIDALGPQGAMQFIQESAAHERSDTEDDNLKRVLIHIDVDPVKKEVVVKFSRPTTWMRFSPADALSVAGKIAKYAQQLDQSLSIQNKA